VTFIPPKPDGNADIEAIADAVDADTSLLLCEFVNSEIGAVTPVSQLVRIVRRKNKNIHIHIDAVQALGKVKFSARDLGVDSMSVSAHKIFAPKGCGALYLRRGAKIQPTIYGGGQEGGIRSGTENTSAVCAFGYMAGLVMREFDERHRYITERYEDFVKTICGIPKICRNSPDNATPYICNIALLGVKSEPMLHFLAGYGVYVSSGSACSKGGVSPVLTAMGLHSDRIDSAIRLSFSPEITKTDIDKLIELLKLGMDKLTR